jgi:hypothetical protein
MTEGEDDRGDSVFFFFFSSTTLLAGLLNTCEGGSWPAEPLRGIELLLSV